VFLALALPARGQEVVQAEESRYTRRLGRLHAKQTWQVLTTEGIETIKGTFGGIANGFLFIQDEDGLRYQVPIGSLVDEEHRILDSFADYGGISLPGEHQQRMGSQDYSEYVYRRETRFRDALELRREYNAAKGPARGWTAIAVPFNPALPMGNFIQQGWVLQPAIPRLRACAIAVPQIDFSPGFTD
jgi:hypothetical protein